MAFQTPIKISTVLERVSSHEYILPAIQREFVWKPEQICRLFDSLMRRYPIGSFLFWDIQSSELDKYVFYEFIRNYHEMRSPHCPVVERDKLPRDRPVTAILDGQQRVTALNIGLRGSHSKRTPRKWWTSPDAFPEKRLYLNLMAPASAEDDLGMEYDFKFLTKEQANDSGDGTHWFLVGDVLKFKEPGDIFDYVVDAGLAEDKDNKFPHRTLTRLHEMVNSEGTISYYSIEEQRLDAVLDIFIRVNSGGTVLSYSDLLLSIATAQWSKRDARETIHGLVDALNSTGQGFRFTKDMVLKAGLVLTDLGDVGFKVSNFNRQNMELLEENWDAIEKALKLGARLLAAFGFSERTLSSDYVLIPVAYYLYKRCVGDEFITSSQFENDRAAVRTWLLRSLLKAGVWGSGQDTLLTRIRGAIQAHGASGFPYDAIEIEMARIGKSLKFGDVEIDEIMDLQYGKPRTFVALAMLYPSINFQAEVHVDHVFPQSLFYRTKLAKAGVSQDEIQNYIDLMNGIPNLQLLPGSVNVQKQDVLPSEWLHGLMPGSDEQSAAARDSYKALHDMHGLPDTMLGFPDFYEARKSRMRDRLRGLLQVK